MQDIMMNEELNSSEDLHYFLTANDQQYADYKESLFKRMAADPLNLKLS